MLNQGLGKASFTDCRFLDNSNPSYGGGAIHCNGSGASLTCQNCLFTGNQSGAHGGALSLQDGTVTLDGCTFQSNNSATANSGSGDNGGTLAMLDARGILHVKGCTFSGNSSAGTGAGIYQKQGRLYVSNTKFLNNTSNNRGIIRLCHGLCFMDKVTVSGSGISGDWGLAFQFSGMDAFCANNLTVANSSASAKSCMPLNGEGKILLVNSTLADSGKGGTMRVEISNNYKFLNSILVSTNSDPALLFNTSKSATVTSLGNCIFGAISGEGDTRVFTPGTGDKKDVAFESLNMNWDAEAGLYTWSGTREGHTRIATASIEGIARTGLPLSVTGTYTDNKQEKTAFTVNDASAAFVDWAKGLDANAFTVDARGVSRGTTATCGAWQAD